MPSRPDPPVRGKRKIAGVWQVHGDLPAGAPALYTPDDERTTRQVVNLSDDDEEEHCPVASTRQIAAMHGRTHVQTIGQGDCLFHAVAAEARRAGLPVGKERARNMHVFWRRAASDCAKQDFVQSLMKANPQREWRRRAHSHAPTEKLAASYPDYIRQQEVWGNTFDVSLLAWCIERQHDIVRPDARSRLVVFDCREGAHVHHAVGTDDVLCPKTRLQGEVRDSDLCIGIDGCHWWSAPPSTSTKRPRSPEYVAAPRPAANTRGCDGDYTPTDRPKSTSRRCGMARALRRRTSGWI